MCSSAPPERESTMVVPADWNQPTAYERWYASSLGRAYGASLQYVLGPWLSRFANSRILDIGCGPGLMERLFPKSAEIIGLDCSLDMARRASARWHPVDEARRFVVGSAGDMPLRADSFDLAFCVNCLEFVDDRQAAFAEIARVLRPEGTAILGVLNRRSIWEITRRARRPFSRHSYYRGRFFTKEELRSHCTQAGLTVEEIRPAVHFAPVPPGPLIRICEGYDRWATEHRFSGGGVLLCRASKRAEFACC